MIVELQLDADTFLTSFREQIRKAVACELTEDVFDLNPSDSVPGEPYIIVGYQAGKTTLRRSKSQTSVCVHTGSIKTVTNRPVTKPEVVQELIVNICWVKDLRASNTHKTTPISFTLPLVFELTMDTCGNPQVLCFNYLGLDSLSPTDPLVQKLGASSHGSCLWLPIDRVIGAYMPKDMKLINGHVSMTESRKCIAVRLEFWDEGWGAATGDPARSLPYWDSFYAGGIIDRLDQADGRAGWNIFLDHYAITGFVKQQVLDSVSGQKGVSVTRQPTADWYDFGNTGGRVHVDLEVEKKDACYCFTEDLDVSAEITADVYITVPKQNIVRIDLNTKVSPDFWDASCCVLTAATFWPILGFGQMAAGKITNDQYTLGYLPFVALIGAILKVTDQHFDAKGAWIQDPGNKDHAYTENHLDLPADPNFGQLSLNGCKPVHDTSTLQAFGLFLWGGMEVFSPPQPVLEDPVLEPFCWHQASRCSTRIAATSSFRLYPTNPQHWALLQVCDPNDARIIDDPYNIYSLELHKEEHGFYDLTASVDFWRMNPDFWKPGGSYPCRVLLKTTGGVRILTYKPLAALSEEQFQAMQRQAQLEYVNNCYYPRHRLFEELDWPIEQIIEQPGIYYVQVRAAGLPPGERVDLVGRQGEELGRFTIDRTGTLLVTALSRQIAGEGTALRLRRTAAGLVGPSALPGRMQTMSFNAPMPLNRPLNVGSVVHEAEAVSIGKICPPEALGSAKDVASMLQRKESIMAAALEGIDHREESGRGVLIRQTMLEEAGGIRLPTASVTLAASGTRLYVVMTDLVEAYDLADADRPLLAESWRAEGIRGGLLFNGNLVLWGKPGMWLAQDGPPARQCPPFCRCEPDDVLGAAVAGGRLFVLRQGALCVYGPDLCQQSRHDAGGEEGIGAVGSFVVLHDREGIQFFDARRGSPSNAERLSTGPVAGLEAPPFALGGGTLYVQGREGGRLLRLRDSGEAELLGEFPGSAWFAGLVRAGSVLAYPIGNGTMVRLLKAGQTAINE